MHRRRRAIARACVACAAALSVTAVALGQDYRIERIASGLNQPTFITQAPGDASNILYFTERTSNTIAGFNAVNQMGKVWRYDVNTRAKTLVLDLSSRSVTQDDGLTAIAFNADFSNPGTPGFHKMYVSSAAAGGASPNNRVEEYTIGAGGTATLTRTVLQYNNTGTAFQNHTVNWIGFDPTATGAARNYLHISTGDGKFSLANRPSQDPSDLQGKMLRVDVSGADDYPADNTKNFGIPSSNPLPTYNAAHPTSPIPGLGEVFVTGLRNASRMSFDRANGDMYIGDVGESAVEELDFLKSGSNAAGPPVDYGWPQHEGTTDTTGNVSNVVPRQPTNPFTGVTSLKPIQQYPHNGAARAIIGGYIYHGPIASLQGQYFFSDYVSGKISDLMFDRSTDPSTFNGNNGTLSDVTTLWNSGAMVYDPNDPNYTPANVGAPFGLSHIVSYGEDNAGNLYVVDFGGFAGDTNFNGQYPGAGQGEIFRLVLVTTSWNVDADGNWSQSGNWLRGIPNGIGAHAIFGGAITAPRIVTIDSPETVGTITFDNAAAYTIAGGGTINLDATSGQVAIEVNNGVHSISAPIAMNDDLQVTVSPASGILTTSNLQATTHAISKSGSGTWAVNSVRAAALTINDGTVAVLVNGTDSSASRIGTLALAGGASTPTATFDLNDNDLIMENGSYAAISASIAHARNGGAWDQPGITSAQARNASPNNKTLGTLTGAQYLSTGTSIFGGQPVAATDTLVKFTWYGDADFNGRVNFDDYVRTDAGFNNGGTDWFHGDFDYNGAVNFDDYVLIDLAFNTQNGTLRRALAFLDGDDRSEDGMDAPGLVRVKQHLNQFGEIYARAFIAAVPEPVSAAVIPIALACFSARHRRRR